MKNFRDLEPVVLFVVISALTVMLMLAVGCGSKSASNAPTGIACSNIQGHYLENGTPTNSLDVYPNCTLTDSYCGYNATFTVDSMDSTGSGYVSINVLGTNGAPGCMSNAVHSCEYQKTSSQLAVSCYNGLFLFDVQ